MRRSKKIDAPSATAPFAPAADPVFWESHVAARLGLGREKIAALRAAHMAVGVHFTHDGNSVVLTPAGVQYLHELLDAEAAQARRAASSAAGQTLAADQAAPAAKESAVAGIGSAQPERVRVVVTQRLGNRHLIYVRPVDAAPGAAPLLVRVKDNQNFHPRLAPFECRRSADGMWYYLGRLPRIQGRW